MNRRTIYGLIIASLATLPGCAISSKPNVVVYPNENQVATQVAHDKYDCQAWAQEEAQFDPNTQTLQGAGVGAVVGAVGGAVAGTIIGAAAGSPGTGAAVGAAVGGVGGAGIGGHSEFMNTKGGYDRAYAACMEARNYTVK